jgi:hypothetical protein
MVFGRTENGRPEDIGSRRRWRCSEEMMRDALPEAGGAMTNSRRMLTAGAAALLWLCGAAGADIQLGEEQVPQDRFVVYIFVGHSNMVGQAKIRDNPPNPRAWRYDRRTQGWVQATDDGSPLMPFLNGMCKAFPDYHIGAIKWSVSAASIEQRYRKATGNLYASLIAAAGREKQRCTLGGVLAMLGFVEAGDQRRANDFRDQVKGMVTEFREDLREPELPFLIGKYEEGARNIRGFREVVREAIYKIPELIPRSVVIDTDGPYVDGHHYNAEGQRLWAREAVRLVVEKRLFPFAPPVRVRLTAPRLNECLKRGAAVTLTAEAASEEGEIAEVAFFDGKQRLGAVRRAPFRFVWKGAAEGIHHLQAAAKDAKDNAAESTVVTVGVGDVPAALMVAGSTALSAGEEAVKRRMEGLGYLVAVSDDDSATPKAVADSEVVLITASCHGLAVRKFYESPIPAVIWNNYCPELRIATQTSGAIAPSQDSVTITDPKHPLAAGLTGTVKVYKRPLSMRWNYPNAYTQIPAALVGKPQMAAIYAYETGAKLPRLTGKAFNRRVAMFMGHFAGSELTEAGWKLFDAAVRWAAAGKPLDKMTREELARATHRYDAWPANRTGLVFLWENASRPNRVALTEGEGTRLCKAEPRGKATYGRFCEMDVAGGSFVADDVAEALLAACRKSQQFAVEATITPAAGGQSGDARIVSFSSGAESCNFMLGHDGRSLVFRLRTSKTGKDGARGVLAPLPAGRPTHVVLTCAPGTIQVYLNGESAGTVFRFNGDLGTWEKQHLVFGDEWAGGADWRGRIEGVALYARWMNLNEARERYALYSRRLKERKDAPHVRLLATLKKASRPPEPADAYPRSLVINLYRVRRILSGKLGEDSKEVLVAQWATLDGKPLARVRGRKAGEDYTLTLEPFSAHPQLDSEERHNETGKLDLPVFYDVER